MGVSPATPCKFHKEAGTGGEGGCGGVGSRMGLQIPGMAGEQGWADPADPLQKV